MLRKLSSYSREPGLAAEKVFVHRDLYGVVVPVGRGFQAQALVNGFSGLPVHDADVAPRPVHFIVGMNLVMGKSSGELQAAQQVLPGGRMISCPVRNLSVICELSVVMVCEVKGTEGVASSRCWGRRVTFALSTEKKSR